ncbi:hypothetical protein B4919_02325 [Francisella tularensis subsp. novicida]|uniref:transposase n=1 Tax=Francisella tularensis TaxID=263 RepID=UPI000CE2A2CB|nr:hypothetical protein B4919_02325 [Francisella tularensis subsp. novicida]
MFSTWIKYSLLSSLKTTTLIVIDNSSFNNHTNMLNIIRNANHIIEFLTPYSPNLNLIENKSAVKNYISENRNAIVKKLVDTSFISN